MKFWRRLQHFLHARRFEQELAEEIRLHREMAGANLARGSGIRRQSRRLALWLARFAA